MLPCSGMAKLPHSLLKWQWQIYASGVTPQIGHVQVGSEHKIALQTMTTTDTRDVEATVDQVGSCIRIPLTFESTDSTQHRLNPVFRTVSTLKVVSIQ